MNVKLARVFGTTNYRAIYQFLAVYQLQVVHASHHGYAATLKFSPFPWQSTESKRIRCTIFTTASENPSNNGIDIGNV